MPLLTISEFTESGNYSLLVLNRITGSPELVLSGNDITVWISFDTIETFQHTATFFANACLRGYMWWALT